MKHIKILAMFILIAMTTACDKEEKQPSVLKMDNLIISSGETIQIPGSITFSAEISDVNVKLSTLEVTATVNGKVVAKKSIRTKGNTVTLSNETLDIPFTANLPQSEKIKLSFEAINVTGESIAQAKEVSINRPTLPETLYMYMNGEVFEMTQDTKNANLYMTEQGEFNSVASAKIATNGEDMEQAQYIWGSSNEKNIAQIIEFGGDDFNISYPKFIVEQYAFNAVTFEITPIGEEMNIIVNGVELSGKDGYMYGKVDMTKGAEVEISGIKNFEDVYNRDFFSYEGGKFTFLRESGTWEIYYSSKLNYMWINKMDDVAPACLWIVGHGFICAPKWDNEYNDGGWDTENPSRMGYAVKTGDNIYQCSMYINNTHVWESFEFEIYSDRESNKTKGLELESINGATGFVISSSKGITNDAGYAGFTPGYYRLIFDNSAKSVLIEKI